MSCTVIAWIGGLLVMVATAPVHARPGSVIIIDPDELGQVEQVAPQEPIAVDRGTRAERPRAIPSFEDRRYRRFASPTLTTFASDAEFRRYLADVRRVARVGMAKSGIGDPEILIAATQDAVEVEDVCTLPEDCPQEESSVVVTGARIAATPSITNNQIAAVDEGDIVKRIGDYLLVLQDGRIFAVHFPTMRLTDRIDVYRRDSDGDPRGADWYDEMLVQGDQVIVTAYSYEDDASEISVFRLDAARGRLEARGVFLISSDDYYDVDNYATRIVGDKLVIYTPYEAEQLESRTNRPTVRRWEPAEDDDDERRGGRPVLDADRIYRPVEGIADPWVHTISVCPLGRVAERGLQCRSTGFVAAAGAEMFVSERHVYLWTGTASDDDYSWQDCEADAPRAAFADAPPGAVFRVPLDGDGASVMGVRGAPFDQFGMSDAGGRFRALANIYTLACDNWRRAREVALLDVSHQRFGDTYRRANARDFTALPQVPGSAVENRFTDGWLVYGGRSRYSRRPADDEEGITAAAANRLFAVPLAEPERVSALPIGHSLIRLERIGADAVIANGYRDESGLRLSYIGLENGAGIASSAFLPGRYESESRSHAFNATRFEQGGGLMGIPTVTRTAQSGGWWWYSDTSDLSFIGFDPSGRLSDAGSITATAKDEVETAEGYDCEVSCVDWYGNARPIFIDGRIYGLMATQLVEADLVAGKVAERRRLDLTGMPRR